MEVRIRRYMYEPIYKAFQSAALLSDAVDAHLHGDVVGAKRLLVEADIDEIRAWQWPIESKLPWKRLSNEPLSLLKQARAKPRHPTGATRQIVIDRDGYHCRFCGLPVISSDVRKCLSVLYGEAIPWSRKFHECHAGFQCLTMSFDHVLPHERGGTSDPENIVVACGPCNYARMSFTLREVEVDHPLKHPSYTRHWFGYDRWDGLTRLLASGSES